MRDFDSWRRLAALATAIQRDSPPKFIWPKTARASRVDPR